MQAVAMRQQMQQAQADKAKRENLNQQFSDAFTNYIPTANVSPRVQTPGQNAGFDYGGRTAPSMQDLAPIFFKGMQTAGPEAVSPLMSIAQMLQPQRPEAYTLNEGDARYEGGREVARNPKPAPEVDYNEPFLPGGAPNQPFQDYQRGLREAGRPQVNTTVNAGNSFASGLGGKTADMLDARSAAASGAVEQIETGNRVLDALDSGKVIAGPGATFRVIAQQVFGNDPEVLQNTRTVIQGLAESTLNSRAELKGQGQITEFEQRTLEKARSGNIDALTVAEIRTIVQVNDRLARTRIRLNRDFVQRASKLPGAPPGFVEMFNVDEPPARQTRQAAPQQPASGGGQFQEGQVYQDAQGNKARYQGGQWVPVQ